MKYIMFEVTMGGIKRKVPVIFPSTLIHREVAVALSKLCSSRIVGAGECEIRVKSCSGNSTTLKIGSKKGDADIINTYNYTFGLMTDESVLKEILRKIEEADKINESKTKYFGKEL